MAGGQLVPHTLPDGRTVMVPDYLVPRGQGALAMPEVQRPTLPDLRTADVSAMLGAASPQFQQILDASKAPPAPSPLAMAPVAPEEDAEERRKRLDTERATAAAKEHAGKADPKKLKPVPKPDPRRESNVIADTAADLYGNRRGGGAAQPKADPENLRPVVAEIKQERQPGMRMLPEQEWRLGLSERPDFPDEIDPDAEQPTIGTDEPIRRKYKTPLERGAESYGKSARAEFEQQVQDQRELNVARQGQLVEQSNLIDSQLNTIAERRNRIAKLQETADKRMQEAQSFEPRTRGQVWEQKSGLARVMGQLAMAIGGYTQGAGRSGGKNPGLDIVNQILDEEVEGERHKAESRRKIGLDAKNDVERAWAIYGDLDMATLDAKNRKLASVMALTQQHMADRSLDAMAKDRAGQIYAAAEEQFLESRRQLFDQITGKSLKEEVTLKPYGQVLQQATPKPTGGGGAGGMTPAQKLALSKDVTGLAVKMPDGSTKFVRSPQQRIDMQEKLNSAADMVSNLRQLQRLRADKENTIPWSKKRGAIDAINSNLITLQKSKAQMGALDKGLIEFAGKQFGKPEEFNVVDQTIDGKIEENIRLLKNEVRKAAERDLDDQPFNVTEGGVTPDEVHD